MLALAWPRGVALVHAAGTVAGCPSSSPTLIAASPRRSQVDHASRPEGVAQVRTWIAAWCRPPVGGPDPCPQLRRRGSLVEHWWSEADAASPRLASAWA
eukprot:5285599-Pyramimonas_sp.AAC.1